MNDVLQKESLSVSTELKEFIPKLTIKFFQDLEVRIENVVKFLDFLIPDGEDFYDYYQKYREQRKFVLNIDYYFQQMDDMKMIFKYQGFPINKP